MVVNPRAIKDFARACMQRAKTDAVDAGGILEYLERMRLLPHVVVYNVGGLPMPE
jgi:transposase